MAPVGWFALNRYCFSHFQVLERDGDGSDLTKFKRLAT